MKRKIIPIFLLIVSISITSAGGVGISPAYYKDFFEPGLEKTYTFHSFNTDSTKGVKLYVKGDLAEYVNLSKTYLIGSGDFIVTIKLPEKITKPGTHKISIGAMEDVGESSGGNIGGIAAIQGRIDILVPYPGKYTESIYKIFNINQGEDAKYELEIQNLGTQSVKVNSMIEIFKPNKTESTLTETISESNIKSKEALTIKGTMETRDFPPGEYQTFVTVEWEEGETILNQTFKVGEFLVEISDYDYQFEKGRINPFRIEIQNKWNSKINEVFATVSITDNGVVVGDFKTASVDTNPWEVKNITGYFDTTNLETKRYTARIDLSYEGETTSKLVAIYINDPPTKTYKNYIIAAVIAALLVIAAFVYLIWKVNKLSNKNGKKK